MSANSVVPVTDRADERLAEAIGLLAAIDRFYQVNDGIPPLTLLTAVRVFLTKEGAA